VIHNNKRKSEPITRRQSTRGTYKNQTKNINVKSAIHNNKRKFEPVTRRQLHTNSESNQIKLEKPYASHDILRSRTDIHQYYHTKREAKRVNQTFHYWHQQRMSCSTHSKYGEVIRTLSIKPFTREKLNHVCQPVAHCVLSCRKK
jgi:hypothetical protein